MSSQATQAIALSEESRLLLGTRAGKVFAFSALDSDDRAEYSGLEGQSIRALAGAPDGTAVLAFNSAGQGLVWDRLTRQALRELRSPLEVVRCAAFGPLDYVTLDCSLTGHVWSGVTAEIISDESGRRLSFERFGVLDAHRLVLVDGFRWRIWDRRTREIVSSHSVMGGLEVDNPSGDVGVSANGRYFYIYWDRFLVFDTVTQQLLRESEVLIDPLRSELSGDGQFLIVSGTNGAVVVVGPDGRSVFDQQLAEDLAVQVSINGQGGLATFVDGQGGAACIDIAASRLLIDGQRMHRILETA